MKLDRLDILDLETGLMVLCYTHHGNDVVIETLTRLRVDLRELLNSNPKSNDFTLGADS